MFKTVAMKQWPEIRARIWTYPVVALTLTLFLQEANSFFLAVIGVFLALDMAVQAGGDDVRWNSFEFIFTRAINRRAYLTSRFLFGLIPLAALGLLYAVFELSELKSIYWALISEPISTGETIKTPFAEASCPGYYTVLAFMIFLVYSTVFFFCSTTRKESSFGSLLLTGFIGTVIYTAITTHLLDRFLFTDGEGLNHLFHEPLFTVLMSALLAVPAVLLFVFSREHYARCELPMVSRTQGGSSSSTGLWLIVIVFIVIILTLFLTMAAPESSPGG